MYMYICNSLYIYMCIYICICIYIYTYIHVYVYIHSHTHTHSSFFQRRIHRFSQSSMFSASSYLWWCHSPPDGREVEVMMVFMCTNNLIKPSVVWIIHGDIDQYGISMYIYIMYMDKHGVIYNIWLLQIDGLLHGLWYFSQHIIGTNWGVKQPFTVLRMMQSIHGPNLRCLSNKMHSLPPGKQI